MSKDLHWWLLWRLMMWRRQSQTNKAQGPDGFTAELFQSSWSIVGKRVTKAILEFFSLPSSPQPADYLQCECAILSGKLEAITFPSLVTVQSCQLSVFSVFLFGWKFILALNWHQNVTVDHFPRLSFWQNLNDKVGSEGLRTLGIRRYEFASHLAQLSGKIRCSYREI